METNSSPDTPKEGNVHPTIKPSFRFPKHERLCSKKAIDAVFSGGIAFSSYPIRLVVAPLLEPDFFKSENVRSFPVPGVKIMISVPKRNHRKAVARNLLKRRIREAWRLNKHQFASIFNPESPTALAIVYTGREIFPYAYIEKKLLKVLGLLLASRSVLES